MHAAAKDKMLPVISPMLACLVAKPFDDPDWLFEIKWDGYRALAFVKMGQVELKSRSNKTWNGEFSPIVKALEKLKGEVILDGEVVILDKEGKSQFQLMQNYKT